MKKIFIDSEQKCHMTNPDGSYITVETSAFDNMCDAAIECYCYDTSKGYVQIYPWKPYSELDNAQRDYERQLLAEYESALAEIEKALGVSG